jgi:hypothetical protein
MATQEITIIATAPTTIKLRWSTNGFGTSTLVNNTTLSSVFGFEKIGGYSPLVSGLPNWTDGGPIILGATSTAPTKATTRQADKVYYKQIGIKTWQVEMIYRHDSAVGSAAGSGDYLITLPNNLRFEQTILTQAAHTSGVGTNSYAHISKGLPGSQVLAGSTGFFGTGPCVITPWDQTRFRVIIHVAGSAVRPWGSGWLALSTETGLEVRINFTFQSL